MRPFAFFATLLFVCVGIAVFLSKRPVTDADRVKANVTLNSNSLASVHVGASRPVVEGKPVVKTATEQRRGASDRFHSIEVGDAPPRAEPPFSREYAQKRYENSPARDTPECQGILRILSSHGYGIEYLEPAYKTANDAHSFSPERLKEASVKIRANGKPYDPNNPEHAEVISRSDEFSRQLARQSLMLLLRPSEADEPMVDEILKYAPTMPYNAPRERSKPGEYPYQSMKEHISNPVPRP